MISQINARYKALISNYIHIKLSDVIIIPCLISMATGLAKPPFEISMDE